MFHRVGIVHAFLITECLLCFLLFLQLMLGLELALGLWILVTHGFGG